MAKWQRELDLSDVWPRAESGELSACQLAGTVADRLAALAPIPAVEDIRQELIESFRILADFPDLDGDEFDAQLERLYDWGDIALDDKWNGKKVCWIKQHA